MLENEYLLVTPFDTNRWLEFEISINKNLSFTVTVLDGHLPSMATLLYLLGAIQNFNYQVVGLGDISLIILCRRNVLFLLQVT